VLAIFGTHRHGKINSAVRSDRNSNWR